MQTHLRKRKFMAKSKGFSGINQYTYRKADRGRGLKFGCRCVFIDREPGDDKSHIALRLGDRLSPRVPEWTGQMGCWHRVLRWEKRKVQLIFSYTFIVLILID